MTTYERNKRLVIQAASMVMYEVIDDSHGDLATWLETQFSKHEITAKSEAMLANEVVLLLGRQTPKVYEIEVGVRYWVLARSTAEAIGQLLTFMLAVEGVGLDEFDHPNDWRVKLLTREEAEAVRHVDEDKGDDECDTMAKAADRIIAGLDLDNDIPCEDAVFACSEW